MRGCGAEPIKLASRLPMGGHREVGSDKPVLISTLV